MDTTIIGAIIAAIATVVAAIIGILKHEPKKKKSTTNNKKPERTKILFLAGCGFGNRIALLPLPPDENSDVTGLNEFIESLRKIGVKEKSIMTPIVEARDVFTRPSSKTLEQNVLKNLIEKFFTALSKIPNEIQSVSTTDEFHWFKLGHLLYEIATLRVMGDEALPSIVALESLTEQMGLPNNLREEIQAFIVLARTKKKQNLVYESANQIAQAIYSLY